MANAISGITLAEVKHYLRIEDDFTDDDDEVQRFMTAAVGFMVRDSGHTYDELDADDAVTMVYLKLVSEMYHNRTVSVDYKVIEDPVYKMAIAGNRKIFV